MSKRGFRITKEIKEKILNHITNESVSVAQAAKDYGRPILFLVL